MGRNIKILILVLVAALALTACAKDKEEANEQLKENLEEDYKGGEDMVNQLDKPTKGDLVANIITNHGEIKVKLLPEAAPKAVENFIEHSKEGYYEGVIFHRVIDTFMIQGGDPTGTGSGGESIWGQSFKDEFSMDARNYRGALSMANAGPNTNGSQFFIVQTSSEKFSPRAVEYMEHQGVENGFPEEIIEKYKELGGTPHLDFLHTVFGQVYEGMDVVDKIAGVEVDANDRPIEDVVIEKIEIEELN